MEQEWTPAIQPERHLAFVSITRLRVRSWKYLPAFLIAALRSALQARQAKGNIAIAVLADVQNTFWTRSLWRDEGSMREFMRSGAHLSIMPHLLEWCDEASVSHWSQDSIHNPTWEEAHEHMQRDGRPSKVNHPSDAQRRFDIPAPKVSRNRQLRFK